jgi:hypothetical protein
VFIRHPPATIRYEADRPVALLGVRTAPWYRLVDLPLGPPTTSARSERGTWALFALGEEVVVVHPDGAVSGPPADVAAEVGRLAVQERQGELDRQAARTIRQLLVGDGAGRAGPARRSGARAWSVPAAAYWLSGPDNDHGHDHTCQAGMACSLRLARSLTGSQPLDRRQPRARARHAFPQRRHRSIHGRRRIAEASQWSGWCPCVTCWPSRPGPEEALHGCDPSNRSGAPRAPGRGTVRLAVPAHSSRRTRGPAGPQSAPCCRC